MLRLHKNAADSHADLLIGRYERLRAWALQLTEQDPERAQELLQDFFVHFTVTRPELNSIQDIDSYLFVVMRNLHLSQVRSANRSSQRMLSIVEFDSVEVGLWAADPRDRIRMQDELRAVCRYACRRKESSKAGSVLILRFFHGYYPEEIAKMLRVTRPAIKEHLRFARAEARAYLDDPERLSFMQDDKVLPTPKINSDQSAEDLSGELRNAIFDSRQGQCLTSKEQREFYDAENVGGPDCKTLAHIVSCSDCLDGVNAMLGLPLLSSRYPVDTIGKDTRRRGGPGKGTGGGAAGGGPERSFVNKYLRRAKQVIQHEPEELCVAVNGYLQGSHKISSERSELTLVVDNSEAIGFVEVFSEQGIRLLLLNIDPLPRGAVKQAEHVELSAGRTIDASLSFSTAWPTIHVVYHDPNLNSEHVVEAEIAEENDAETGRRGERENPSIGDWSPLRRFSLYPRLFLRSLTDWSFWLRPGTITAVLALLLVVAMLSVLLHRAPIAPNHALEVLSQATTAEQTQAAQPNQVLHRTFFIEEWISNQLRSRQRIEMWQKGGTEVAARRVYDADGRLQNGEWRRADGSRLLFNHGAKLRNAPAREAGAEIKSAEIWRLTPSAEEFKALISAHGDPSLAQIEERPTSYILYFTDKSATSGLIEARLVLNRADFHAVAMTLIVTDDGQLTTDHGQNTNRQSAIGNRQSIEYRFTEAAYERKSVSDVAPSVFEPDPALLSGATKVTAPLEPLKNESAKTPLTATAPVASLELEVEVLRLLNQVNALSGEQIALTRVPAGYLRVQGIVDTEERKGEIFRALGSVKNNPAVRVEIETAAVAAARQKASNTGTTSLESVALQMDQAMPVGADLQRYFAQKGLSSEQTEAEMKRFAGQAQARARQMRRQALALKQLAEHFSAEDVRQMDAARREEWKGLLRERAQSVASEVETLTQQLGAIFPNSRLSADSSLQINDEADFAAAARKLWELATACDTAVNQSFSIYSTGEQAAVVKTPTFWKNLADVAHLAAQISKQ